MRPQVTSCSVRWFRTPGARTAPSNRMNSPLAWGLLDSWAQFLQPSACRGGVGAFGIQFQNTL